MGTHWNSGLIRWQPHIRSTGQARPLNHLHPFRFEHALDAINGKMGGEITVCVGFGLHCFTRKLNRGAEPVEPYSDERETREFDHDRYELSKHLPTIVRSLATRPCGFGRNDNFVSVDVLGNSGESTRYAVFFNMKRWPRMGPRSVLLVVQSAYRIQPDKPKPFLGRISFDALIRHALKGTRPKLPR
jgi:hypothetical protein